MWQQALPAGAAAIAVLLLPGVAAGLILRLRGFALVGVAAMLSLAAIGAASLVSAVLPVRWSVLAWLGTVVALLAIAVVVRVLSRRVREDPAPREDARTSWFPFAIALTAAIVCGIRLAAAIGAPDAISQTFDNVYHLNAVRWIVDTGTIAPTQQLIPGFYPSLWHALTATVVVLSGASIPVAVNATAIVVGAVIWPASCIHLVRVIMGTGAIPTVAAGVLSVGTFLFPMLMLDFGVLYPNVLSIALLPSVLACLVWVAGIGRGERPGRLLRWVLLFAGIPTLALAHPSTLMAFFLFGFWIALAGLVRWWRAADPTDARLPRRRLLAVLAFALGTVAAGGLFVVARPTMEQGFWPPSETLGGAAWQLATLAFVGRGQGWPLTIVAIVGAIAVLAMPRLRASWWLLASWATLAIIIVVCLGYPAGRLRYLFSGTWYQDVNRIVALLPVLLVPLGAIGVYAAARWIRDAIGDRGAGWIRVVVPTAAAAVAVAALFITTQIGSTLDQESRSMARVYAQTDTAPLLTNDERALLDRLDDLVAPDEVIIGSPWTGTSLAYALADRAVLVPHIFTEASTDTALLLEHLRDVGTDVDVCPAVERTGARWVLDFGSAGVHGGAHPYPGIEGLADEPGDFHLAAEQGDAKLYEITACR